RTHRLFEEPAFHIRRSADDDDEGGGRGHPPPSLLAYLRRRKILKVVLSLMCFGASEMPGE
ncbi:hypothetical protein MUK42_28623, partial [Musa troglodytarum]